jgi:uncharacterized protein (DUF849 family)
LPDCASVNWHEDGAVLLAEALLGQGVAVEAGLWTLDAARSFRACHLVGSCRRVLLEPMEQELDDARVNAEQMVRTVADTGLPVLLHGVDATAWPMLEMAAARGLQLRVGLEDVLSAPDGRTTVTNADLVAAAVAIANPTSIQRTAQGAPLRFH